MSELNLYINKAFEFEEKGCFEEAIQLCSKCRQAFPEYRNEISLEIAKMNYRNGREREALMQFLVLYRETGEIEVHDLILEAYYGVRQQEYEEQYRENCRRLEQYSHFYGKKGMPKLRYYPIWADQGCIWFYDSEERAFESVQRRNVIEKEAVDAVYLGYNLQWLEDILALEKMTRLQSPLLDMENPLLLLYQRSAWELLCQLIDLKELINFDRIIFYDDAKELEDSIVKDGVCLPTMVVGNEISDILHMLGDINGKLNRLHREYQLKAETYYLDNADTVLKHIKDKKPKILFITSRFTTALQYHTRDCRLAAEEMGLETELLIEKDRLSMGISMLMYLKKIMEFQPDIIFIIDHFRYEYQCLGKFNNMVFVCWAQDPINNIFSQETVQKLIERDVVISNFCGWKKFLKIGYPEKRLISCCLPANHKIYHPYLLSDVELEQYGCDICMVGHNPGADKHIELFVENFSGELKDFVRDLYQSYIRYARETDQIFMRQEEFYFFIEEFAAKFYGFKLKQNILDVLSRDMREILNYNLFRELLADWLIKAGYTNIKLWGNGWKEMEKYRPYAMGPAENGEVLSKILQASKIVVGNNIALTGASRVAEAMLSGAFYLGNYVPEEEDMVNIRDYFTEGEELVIFRDKEDFLNKTAYYLEHESERRKLADAGRKKALEKLTYERFMHKVIEETAEMF